MIRDKSICANCMSDESRFLQQKHNKKQNIKVVGIMFHIVSIIKHADILFKVQKRYRKY